ncbi:hypothetical protein ACFU3O_08025 [Streptomyces antibioticus]|uniref:hypothetical protein n=1 Tax=Streptomyces antibioticus TaxID=1890 RepID=UPI00367EDA92
MVVDDGVLVPAHVPDGFVELTSRIREVLAHSLGQGDAVGLRFFSLAVRWTA